MFKNKQEKEVEKRILVKKTLTDLKKHISALESQKQSYIASAKKAKQKGADAQYNLALSGLKMAMVQQQKAEEMLLNFEITSQMKDMSAMTGSFLQGMGLLSKEMCKLTKDKEFKKVQAEFEKAMIGVEMQTERMEVFLDSNQSSFADVSLSASVEKGELEKLIMNEAAEADALSDANIDRELLEIKKKIAENS